ncbi:3-deoxy-7-phosphoheptulonate synthase [Tengunoibacter tsumagoiensis]|uniref:3-deoxy-7-phosphoheptulonate synthase n=1 Tax=Tengunoibacter tsumagoiensis TaxID=2014871 RepID=A0A402A9J2_9CHLR|nr:3-deoxy-7-phosphoheptulonate synthase [Tengunoibacter tsumagoiensis]GCE15625.1 3-deoxy-7-phosphoheptulonate synthase [Tengunoibacter tsumagoiensis]
MSQSTIIKLHNGSDVTQLLAYIPYARYVEFAGSRWIVSERFLPKEEIEQRSDSVEVVYSSTPYPLASKALGAQRTIVQVGAVSIGAGHPVMIAGPCSVESRDQLLSTATHLAQNGCHILRGGAYKPRTSPYSFQGLQHDGLKLLAEARALTGLPIVTEVMSPQDVELVATYADMLQIGARNMQNFPLLAEAGRSGKPILLKRSPWATLTIWLQAAEYILSEGNFQVVLCERGICTSEASAGRHLDLTAIQLIPELSHLPIIADPSHGTGQRSLVTPMAIASLITGADGIMVEVHPEPDKALSDGKQTLSFQEYDALIEKAQKVADTSFSTCVSFAV